MNSQRNGKNKRNAQLHKKGGWECRKHLRYETKPKHIKWRSRHFSQVIRESRFGCPRIARVISSEELGTMSKNNLRRITLVRGPIWGIHSLTLIISCSLLFLSLHLIGGRVFPIPWVNRKSRRETIFRVWRELQGNVLSGNTFPFFVWVQWCLSR